VWYSYEGDVVPYDESAGWLIGNACQDPCVEFVEDGVFGLYYPHPGDLVNYHYTIAWLPDLPPPTLWVEWHFRSNHPIGPNFYTCDARFSFYYRNIHAWIHMYGDATISNCGGYALLGLGLDKFHTYRFESVSGFDFRVSVDGDAFWIANDPGPDIGHHYIQTGAMGGCPSDWIPDMRDEWDFIRYGTISYGERIVTADPPGGFLDSALYSGLDRFTVTFEEPNYVYLDEITVEATGSGTPLHPPVVLQTRRLDNGPPEVVEVVLDRPLPPDARTTFTFNDGAIINTVSYTFQHGDVNADGQFNLRDWAGLSNCFHAFTPLGSPCACFDLDGNLLVDLADHVLLLDAMSSGIGP
jgi:hypothetical protein